MRRTWRPAFDHKGAGVGGGKGEEGRAGQLNPNPNPMKQNEPTNVGWKPLHLVHSLRQPSSRIYVVMSTDFLATCVLSSR